MASVRRGFKVGFICVVMVNNGPVECLAVFEWPSVLAVDARMVCKVFEG